MTKLPSNKINPYKILVLLLYHDYSWAIWDCDRCTIQTPKLARLLGKSSYRIREYIKWLQEKGYIYDLSLNIGTLSFTVTEPPNLISLKQFNCTQNECNCTQIEFEMDDDSKGAESDSQANFDPDDPWSQKLN